MCRQTKCRTWTCHRLCAIHIRWIFIVKPCPKTHLKVGIFFLFLSWLYFWVYLGEKKWSIFKNFFCAWSFGLEKSLNVIFFKFVIGGRGGVQNLFCFNQLLSGEILTFFALKSSSLAPRIAVFSFGHKRIIWSTLSFLKLQKNFFGLKWIEFHHKATSESRKKVGPPLALYIFL